jgi:seryl-tRNA synthetase
VRRTEAPCPRSAPSVERPRHGRGDVATTSERPAAPRRRSGLAGRPTYDRAVIDLRLVREHPDVVKASQRARGADESLVDELLAADAARREAVKRADDLRGEQKAASQAVRTASPDERPAILERAKKLAADVKDAEEAQRAADAALRDVHLKIPNVVADEVPPGGEDDAVTLRTVGEVPDYDFPVRDHLEIGEALGAIDMERGAKVSGSRFYFLTGPGALLEFALAQLAISRAVAAGFTPVIAPALVRPEVMEGTGFLGEHDEEVYRVERDDLYLVGTSEVALAGMHRDEVLDLAAGPRRYAGWSSCFRREAGSYGRDTRGLIRVHWFDKVEMFSFSAPEDTTAEHLRLLQWEEEFLQALELPYRVVDIAAGDLGTSAVRKFDIEAWFPSQGTYRELTSTSDCGTFQARRLNIRYRDADGKNQIAATLNGTLCAVARTIACLLEVHQRADGSVHVPAALRPWLGGVELLTPGMPLPAPVPVPTA